MQQRQSGFTLIELMIVMLVIGLLGAIALPSYSAYVMRARLAEAHSTLALTQTHLEQYWTNKRTYVGFDAAGAGLMPPDGDNFDYSLDEPSKSAYTLIATGKNAADGFVFTLNQNGNRATTETPTGWDGSDECWVDQKGGLCSQ